MAKMYKPPKRLPMPSLVFRCLGSRQRSAPKFHLLERILLKDDRISNPYLTWSRQELVSALMQRKEQLPKNSSRVSYRLSLEAADQNRRFPFMKLPSEIRMMVYENIMQVDFGKEISAKENSKFSAPIMSVSRQVRREATTILLQNLRTTDIRLHGGLDWALPDLVRQEEMTGLQTVLSTRTDPYDNNYHNTESRLP